MRRVTYIKPLLPLLVPCFQRLTIATITCHVSVKFCILRLGLRMQKKKRTHASHCGGEDMDMSGR